MKNCLSTQLNPELIDRLSQNDLELGNNFIFTSGISNSRIFLKHVRLYDCALLQLTRASLQITTSNGYEITIPPYSICYIEKNTIFNASISVINGDDCPYNIYYIKNDILKSVCKATEALVTEYENISLIYNKKVFFFHATEAEHTIFYRLLNTEIPQHRLVYKIAYLLSKFEPYLEVIHSLERCIAPTLTEKVKQVVSNDLTRQWRLCDLSKHLHMSEISIRKKLEAENNSFNSLLRDMRMQQAARILKRRNSHINTCAKMTGYTSTSYFIKVFKDYFGITPKQFSLKVKGRNTFSGLN